MLSKFFKRRPQAGMPVAAIEADGLAAMDHAWATLDCLGGYVDWSHGRPTIVPNGSSGEFGGAGGLSRLYRVRYVDGNIQIYGVGGDDVYRVNGVDIKHESTEPTGKNYNWWTYAVGVEDINAVIYVVPTAPAGSSTYDYTNTEASNIIGYGFEDATAANGYEEPTGWIKRAAKPIAYIRIVDGKLQALVQLHTGRIAYQWLDGDKNVSSQLGPGSSVQQSSIERINDHGALQINGFDDPDYIDIATEDVFAAAISFIMRDATSNAITRYIRGIDLKALIESLITEEIGDTDYTDLIDHPDLATLKWDLSGHFGEGTVLEPVPVQLAAFDTDGTAIYLIAIRNHSELEDIAEGEAGDDHQGANTDTEIGEGNGNFGYVALTGTEIRNTMPSGAKIKMQDETPADIEGNGTLIVNGGGQFGKGLFVKKGDTFVAIAVFEGAGSGIYTNGLVEIDNTTDAGDTTGSLVTFGGARVIKSLRVGTESGGDYYHKDNKGGTTASMVSGGIVREEVIEIDASDLQPGDKILVRRAAP